MLLERYGKLTMWKSKSSRIIRDSVIPKNKTVVVLCRANLCLNEKWTPVIFEPHVNPDVLDGLSVTEAVVNLKRWIMSTFQPSDCQFN